MRDVIKFIKDGEALRGRLYGRRRYYSQTSAILRQSVAICSDIFRYTLNIGGLS